MSMEKENFHFSSNLIWNSIFDDINRSLGYQVKIRHFVQLFILFFRAVSRFKKYIFVECMIKCSKALCINCILRSIWKHLKPSKSQWFSTICSIWMRHLITLHEFTSGRHNVAPHNTLPQCTTVPQGTAWCIIFWNRKGHLLKRKITVPTLLFPTSRNSQLTMYQMINQNTLQITYLIKKKRMINRMALAQNQPGPAIEKKTEKWNIIKIII